MACRLIYNSENKPTGVLDSNGAPSKLFNQIISNPHIKDFDTALEIYKAAYANKKVYYSVIGENTAQKLDELLQATTNLDNLAVAKKMTEEGKEPLDVKEATGWELGVEGKWKKEVPRGNFKIDEVELNKAYNIGDILEDNDAVKVYPNIKVKFIYEQSETEGGFNPATGEITINVSTAQRDSRDGRVLGERGEIRSSPLRGNVRALQTLLHELSHALQHREGFAVGGSPDSVRGLMEKLIPNFQTITEKELDNIILKKNQETLSNNERIIIKLIQDYTKEKDLLKKSAIIFKAYQNLAGEVEARYVENNLEIEGLFYTPQLIGQGIEDRIVVEPTLFYKTPKGEFYTDFQAALIATSNGVIEGIVGGEVFFTISSSIDNNSFNGLLNDFIRTKVLTGQQILDQDGNIVHITGGATDNKKLINASIVEADAQKTFGFGNVKRNKDNNFIFTNMVGKVKVIKKNGKEEITDRKTLDEKEFDEIVQDYQDPESILAERELRNSNRILGSQKILQEQEDFIPENTLQIKLMSLLNKMGVKTMSISRYTQSYAQRNSENPSAQALADLAQRIVAFKDGVITEDALTEETAHFIVEGTDAPVLENLLRNVHRTSQWNEHSDNYRQIYSEYYTGEELEAAVRKEILGKILAKGLQSRFAKEGLTETNQNFYDNLIEIVREFFTKVQAYFLPEYRQELDFYTGEVYRNLFAEELYGQLNLEQINGSKLTLYSVKKTTKDPLTKLHESARQAVDILANQQSKLKKGTSRSTINRIQADLDENSKLTAISGITLVAKNQLKYLQAALEKNKDKNFPFAQEENIVYNTMIHQLKPLLNQINSLLSAQNKEENYIKKELEQVVSSINKLEGDVGVNEVDAIQNMVDRIAIKKSMTPEQKQNLLDILKAGQKDTNWLHANIGQLVHAQNPLLNIAGDVISGMTIKARTPFLQAQKKFLNTLEKVGVKPQELKQLKDGGYLISEHDYNAMDEAEYSEKAKLYNSYFPNDIPLTAAQYREKEYRRTLKDLSAEQNIEFYNKLGEIKKSWMVDFLTPEAREAVNKRYEGIDEVAVKFEKEIARELGVIRAESLDKNGRQINTQVTKHQLQEIRKSREIAKNPYKSDGTLKLGLRESVVNGEVELSLDKNRADKEARIAYGLYLLDKRYLEEAKSKEKLDRGIPQAFKDEVENRIVRDEKGNIVDQSEAWDFLLLNSYTGFTNEFWDSIGSDETLADKLQKAKNGENDQKIDDILSELKLKQTRRSRVIKANRVLNQPSETDYEGMSVSEKESVLELSEEIQSLLQEANSILPKRDQTEEQDRTFESRTNKAYENQLDNEGIHTFEEEMEFIRKHVTNQDRQKIDRAYVIAKELINGDRSEVPSNFSFIFKSGSTQLDILEYAQSKLLPYYQRLEPIGYSDLLVNINNNELSLLELLEDTPEYLKITPNYSFFDSSTNENINPEFIENKNAGRPQIKKGMFESVKFKEMFGDVKDDAPTKNKALWEARKAMLELQDQAIESLGLTGRHNRFLLPQQGKRGARQLQDFLGRSQGRALKETFKDLVSYREDEAEFGQTAKGSATSKGMNANIIPTYGVKQLEDKEDVTDELLHSYMWMSQQAFLRQARIESVGDMLALKDAVLNADYGGKEAESTNTYKMFDSFLKYNFYGVKESFSYEFDLFGIKMDLSAVARTFQSWIRIVNLGFSVLTPLTSALQGGTQKFLEERVGERLNPMSASLGRKEFRKLAGDAAKESLNFNSKSRLNVLGESFSVYGDTERFENSNYGKFTRGILKSAQITHSIGNFPVIPSTLLAVLYDFRVVGGDIINFNDFQRLNKGKSIQEVKREWSATESDAIYNYIKTDNGVVEYDKKSLSKLLNMKDDKLDEFIQEKHAAITERAGAAIMDIDSQIPESQKSAANRHLIASFFLMHRGWLQLAVARKFKGRHYNIYSGETEEGSWANTLRFLKEATGDFKKSNAKNYFAHLKQEWDKADETTRRNMTRTAQEIALTNAMILVGLIAANLGDDEDDMYALQFLNYMQYRVTNEMLSSSTALPRQLGEFIESPIVGYDKLLAATELWDLTSSDVVASGRYAGETKRARFVYKNLPIFKEYNRLSDMNKEYNTYKFYNKHNFDWAISTHLLSQEE